MVIASDLELRDLMQQVLRRTFGFLPTNGSIKPVHVANGLARALIGTTYDTTALNRTLVWWVRNQRHGYDEQRYPTEFIAKEYGGVFLPEDLLGHGRKGRLDSLRRLLRESFGTDGAVFDGSEKSSYTLSHQRFVTGDPSDNGVGRLIAMALDANGSHHILDAARAWLADETDPWTTLARPLLSLATERSPIQADGDNDLASVLLDADGKLVSRTLRRQCEAFERLVAFEQQHRDKLNAMRRLVTLACFVCYLFLARRWSELAEGDEFAADPPLLIDLYGGQVPSVAAASHATYKAALQAAEQVIRRNLRTVLREEIGGDSIEEAEAEEFISSIRLPRKAATAQERDRDRYLSRYRALRAEGGYPVFEALVRATRDSGLESLTATPMAFMREIGRRAGFLAPWANRAERKRYSISNEFLELIVVSTLSVGEACEYAEFLVRIREQFGIVAGTPDDYYVIRQNNLSGDLFGAPVSISEYDLRNNVLALRERLRDIGYAKTYADGTTIVTVE